MTAADFSVRKYRRRGLGNQHHLSHVAPVGRVGKAVGCGVSKNQNKKTNTRWRKEMCYALCFNSVSLLFSWVSFTGRLWPQI